MTFGIVAEIFNQFEVSLLLVPFASNCLFSDRCCSHKITSKKSNIYWYETFYFEPLMKTRGAANDSFFYAKLYEDPSFLLSR